MWPMLANMVAEGYNLWQQKEMQDEMQEDRNRQIQVSKTLAAEQLAITYNSIAARSIELSAQAKRKEFNLRVEERQAEGSMTAKAATAGVAGRRAELARKMIVNGAAERQIASLAHDTQVETDNLIAQAEAAERQTINRLISNMPDTVADFSTANYANFATGIMDDYQAYKTRIKETEDAIALGSTPSSYNTTWSPRG